LTMAWLARNRTQRSRRRASAEHTRRPL